MVHGWIYLATNTINGKQYVGLTRVGVVARWKQHVWKSRSLGSYFHKAICKHGADAFTVSEFACAVSVQVLPALERDIIRQLTPAYNLTNGGEVTLGRKYDDATKERIRAANTGKRRTEEQRARISAIKKQQWADHPEIFASSIRAMAKARNMPGVEARRAAAAAASAKNRIWSAESRARLSASCMGRKYGADIINRMRESKKRPVRCDTTGEIFSCRTEAAKYCGVSPQSVFRVCNNKYPDVRGLKFSYVR